jgi:hypothetical protein
MSLAGMGGATDRNAVNAILYELYARLNIRDPVAAPDAAAVDARVAERKQRRVTVAELQSELAKTAPGSAAWTNIVDDIVEYSRATTEQEGA